MQMLCLVTGTLFIALFICLLIISGEKYDMYIKGLPEEYKLKEIYPVGFFILDMIHYKYNSKSDIKKKSQCMAIYGKKYGEYYFRLNYAQKASMMIPAVAIALLFCSQATNKIQYIVIPLAVILVFYCYDKQISDVMDERNDVIDRDFADIISKLTLLINAGMIMSEAWEKVAFSGDSILYKEMQKAVIDISKNGVSENEAYMEFADRCMSVKIKKIIAAIIQNNAKGSDQLVGYLLEQSTKCWEEKKQYLRIKGEQASGKLMIPIIIMFAGILIMIIVPIFGNMSY